MARRKTSLKTMVERALAMVMSKELGLWVAVAMEAKV